MRRIGLFGGSFDPVHWGHLWIARTAIEELKLDRLCFIPAARSPFKPAQAPAPARDRLRWLRLALAGWTDCEVDPQEVARGGISYTIDTLRDYARRFPEATLCCLIGADHVSQLPKWREAAELARLAEFAVVARPGDSPGASPDGFRLRHLRGIPVGVSSSLVRERLRAGLTVDFLVPEAVVAEVQRASHYLERGCRPEST